MGALEPLVVVSRAESIHGRQLAAQFKESRILVETASKGPRVFGKYLRNRGIRGQKNSLRARVTHGLQGGDVVYGDWLVPYLPFVIRKVKQLVSFQRPAYSSAELL